jgi:hypothetical protein
MERTEILVSLAVSEAVKYMAKKRMICLNFASVILERE